jgi:hypothetical protein
MDCYSEEYPKRPITPKLAKSFKCLDIPEGYTLFAFWRRIQFEITVSPWRFLQKCIWQRTSMKAVPHWCTKKEPADARLPNKLR